VDVGIGCSFWGSVGGGVWAGALVGVGVEVSMGEVVWVAVSEGDAVFVGVGEEVGVVVVCGKTTGPGNCVIRNRAAVVLPKTITATTKAATNFVNAFFEKTKFTVLGSFHSQKTIFGYAS
jgi:hypothetical protein